jgi:hypothetical protein
MPATAEPAPDTAARLAELRDKLAARDGRPGFGRNARLIRGEIARLEQHAGHAQV